MSLLKSRQRPQSVAETAAAWTLEEQKGLSNRQRCRRDAWLAADPKHEEAYAAALAMLTELDRHAAHPDIVALRQAALGAHPDPRPVMRRFGGWAVCVFAIAIAGAIGWNVSKRFPDLPAAATHATAVGERSTVPLADGSVITLDTASVVEVTYEARERRVRLLKGQALFTVAHGQPAPFRVYAGDRIVTAIGTVFDVRIDDAQVRVSVVEGAVRVEANSGDQAHASAAHSLTAETLVAGQALMSRPDGAVNVKQIDVERLASWRSGLLSFEDTPLTEAIAEVNRYTHRPVSLAHPRLGEYRVSGTFRAGEPERFAQAMTQLFPLTLETSSTGTVMKAK